MKEPNLDHYYKDKVLAEEPENVGDPMDPNFDTTYEDLKYQYFDIVNQINEYFDMLAVEDIPYLDSKHIHFTVANNFSHNLITYWDLLQGRQIENGRFDVLGRLKQTSDEILLNLINAKLDSRGMKVFPDLESIPKNYKQAAIEKIDLFKNINKMELLIHMHRNLFRNK